MTWAAHRQTKTTAWKCAQSESSRLVLKLPKLTLTAPSTKGSSSHHVDILSLPTWQDEMSAVAADIEKVLTIPNHWHINEANQDLLDELEKIDTIPPPCLYCLDYPPWQMIWNAPTPIPVVSWRREWPTRGLYTSGVKAERAHKIATGFPIVRQNKGGWGLNLALGPIVYFIVLILCTWWQLQ